MPRELPAPLSAKRLPGRPRNPYLASNPIWQPKGTLEATQGAALLSSLGEPGCATALTYTLLERIGVPVLRRVIEAILVFDYDLHPVAVTDALEALWREKKIIRLPFPFEHDNDLYFIGERTDKELERYTRQIAALYTRRQAVLNGKRLGKVGEQFVRSVLNAHGDYAEITQEKKLGTLVLPKADRAADDSKPYKPHKLDLKVTQRGKRKGREKRYGVSVKNESRWVTRGDKSITDVIIKAEAHEVLPWLIASFVTDEARDECKRKEVRIDSMGGQIVPRKFDPKVRDSLTGRESMRAEIESLWAVIGPQTYRFIPKRIRDYEPYFFDSL